MLGWCPIAVEAPEQHLRGGSADSRRVLCDDGDAWLQEIGEQDIVESDNIIDPSTGDVAERVTAKSAS